MSNIVIDTSVVASKINNFSLNRPETEVVIAYGSGVFNQTGTENDKKNLDTIFGLANGTNIKDWHAENRKMNKGDYSIVGGIVFKYLPTEMLKGRTGITYISDIKENGDIFKYGTIEMDDLIESLITWNRLYLVGRLHKPVLVLKSTPEFDKLLVENRKRALLVASFLQNNDEVSKKQLLTTVCGLSYSGDIRTTTGFEHPNKVSNIVTGSYDILTDIYDFDTYYSESYGDLIILNRSRMKEALVDLPENIYQYIMPYLTSDDEEIKQKIAQFFETTNKKESLQQTLKGLGTDGPVKSLVYAGRKFMKGLR